MLEDDIEVSALWWHWAQAGLKRYAHLPAVVGISLFTPDDMNEAYENGGTHEGGRWKPSCGWQSRYYRRSAAQHSASAVLFGQPCSWGAVLLPEHSGTGTVQPMFRSQLNVFLVPISNQQMCPRKCTVAKMLGG